MDHMKMKAICGCIVFLVLLQVMMMMMMMMMMMNTMPVAAAAAAAAGEYNGSDCINARNENWLLASEADPPPVGVKPALDANRPVCGGPNGLPCTKKANPGAGRGCKMYYGCST
ncbi:uncharacterized protein LOC120252861 [Dioscorea cayenensis subsp. rotundata]|uniref:Uncharacterized protein LOC120252861 n=1 Tax=Dioscorea cayennensis subsp. rotundata TaxID=55577 RepID=A0AB40APZ0_DIOCR|nr:uncharacterized protein LOC120252861 [Dioscorea cayenensis subsp. rotundata]